MSRIEMKPVAIQLAIANAGQGVKADDVYEFVEANESAIETYELDPPKGRIFAAAVDYTLILAVSGSVASIASLLWMAYDRFIAPKKEDSSDTAGIYVVVMKDDGTSDQYWIGNTHRVEEEFVNEFSMKLHAIRTSGSNGESTEEVISEVRSSQYWRRRK